MANGWVKSLQCKSKALDDVVHQQRQQQHNNNSSSNNKTRQNHLISTSSSCRKSVQSLKDVVEATKPKARKKKHPQSPPSAKQLRSRKFEAGSDRLTDRTRQGACRRPSRAPSDPFFPSLTELPAGHPSRNVVEIIFHTSWSPKAFSGRIC